MITKIATQVTKTNGWIEFTGLDLPVAFPRTLIVGGKSYNVEGNKLAARLLIVDAETKLPCICYTTATTAPTFRVAERFSRAFVLTNYEREDLAGLFMFLGLDDEVGDFGLRHEISDEQFEAVVKAFQENTTYLHADVEDERTNYKTMVAATLLEYESRWRIKNV